MKVTVELSENEMAEILDFTGESKKGPAIRRLMEQALQQLHRAQIAQRFISGEWGWSWRVLKTTGIVTDSEHRS